MSKHVHCCVPIDWETVSGRWRRMLPPILVRPLLLVHPGVEESRVADPLQIFAISRNS
jgi:hypothetical protein